MRVLACVLAAGALVHAGCESSARPEAVRPVPTGSEGAFAAPAVNVVRARPKAGPVRPVALAGSVPLKADGFTAHTPRTLRYVTEKGEPRTVKQEALPACHCAGQTWWVRTYSGEASAPAEREVRLTIDVNGSISKMEEIDRVEKVEVVYTPPLVLVPDKLPSKATNDAVFRQEGQMVVYPLGDRTKVKARGTVKNEIVYAGDEMVRAGGREIRAQRVSARVMSDLGAAKTVEESEVWLADGIGVVILRDRNGSAMILESFE